MLAVSYNPVLVVGAALLAMIAGFTGLVLTNGLSRLDPATRKRRVVGAATVLGGGVWSTHFVAMLALQLPVEIVYDPLYTLASALIAILVTGGALLILHFGNRSQGQILAAGTVMGLGVVAMHFVGMYGMRGCQPVFGVWGYVLSTLLAVVICTGAMQIAYRRRTLPGLGLGGVTYGLAILVMHFSAMSQTGFLALDRVEPTIRMVPNDVLAMLVVFAAFLICGAFLLTTVTLGEIRGLDGSQRPAGPPTPAAAPEGGDDTGQDGTGRDDAGPDDTGPDDTASKVRDRLPYEIDGRTFFVPAADVVAIQADGHYSRLHRVSGPVFCPQPIARLEEVLDGGAFLRTHRSYLVNLSHVAGFERRKDQGVCLFDPALGVEPVPVSRGNMPRVREALGL